MLERWCDYVDRYLKDCKVQGQPLAGVTVRVRHSHRAPYCEIGRALTEALGRYGAELKTVDDMSFALESELGQARLAEIDAFIMIAGTTGASAEALELAHTQIELEHTQIEVSCHLRDRLHVAMPKAYRDGFIRKRLECHKVSLDLYEESELERGIVCAKTIDKMIERKRRDEALEQARLSEFKPRVGIVTALPIEYEAMHSLLDKPRIQRLRSAPGRLQEYIHGTLPAHGGGEHEVVVTRVGVGNNISAAMTERLFTSFKLDEVFMVGIAGGIPRVKDEHPDIRFGDVVVSGRAGIIQYDMVKQKPGEPEPLHPPRPPSSAWLHRAQTLITSTAEMDAFNARLSQITKRTQFKRPSSKTDQLFDDTDETNPKRISRPRRAPGRTFAFEGPVGSANTVMKSHLDRERLREKYKLLAVEMEGSGVAEAAMANGKPFFVIRGICDYANTRKNDVWHPHAAMSAAVFAAMLIESMPLALSD